MKMPIIVIEGGDITFFRTIHDAENHLEAIDIIDQIYEIFDSDGKVLRQSVAKKSVKYFFGKRTVDVDVVHIGDSDERNPEKLKNLLRKFLRVLKDLDVANVNIDDLDLSALIERASRYAYYI